MVTRSVRIQGVFVLMAMILLPMSGCVRQQAGPDGIESFSYEWWMPGVTMLGGVAGILVGMKLVKFIRKLGVAFVMTGLIASLVIGPSMLFDAAVVAEDQFELKTGVWGLTCQHEVDFHELTDACRVIERKTDSKGRSQSSIYLLCRYRDGGTKKIPLGSEVAKAAAPLLMQRMESFGIAVQDQVGLPAMVTQEVGNAAQSTKLHAVQ